MFRKGWSVWKRTAPGSFVCIDSQVNLFDTATQLARLNGAGRYRVGRNDGSRSLKVRVHKGGRLTYRTHHQLTVVGV